MFQYLTRVLANLVYIREYPCLGILLSLNAGETERLKNIRVQNQATKNKIFKPVFLKLNVNFLRGGNDFDVCEFRTLNGYILV